MFYYLLVVMFYDVVYGCLILFDKSISIIIVCGRDWIVVVYFLIVFVG